MRFAVISLRNPGATDSSMFTYHTGGGRIYETMESAEEVRREYTENHPNRVYIIVEVE